MRQYGLISVYYFRLLFLACNRTRFKSVSVVNSSKTRMAACEERPQTISDDEYCTIEASVVTGFEESARGEAREKFGTDVHAARGKITWNVPVNKVKDVLKMGSVDNCRVVIHKVSGFQYADQHESLASLQKLVCDIDWESGLKVWQQVYNFPYPITARPDHLVSAEDLVNVVTITHQPPPRDKSAKVNKKKGGRGKRRDKRGPAKEDDKDKITGSLSSGELTTPGPEHFLAEVEGTVPNSGVECESGSKAQIDERGDANTPEKESAVAGLEAAQRQESLPIIGQELESGTDRDHKLTEAFSLDNKQENVSESDLKPEDTASTAESDAKESDSNGPKDNVPHPLLACGVHPVENCAAAGSYSNALTSESSPGKVSFSVNSSTSMVPSSEVSPSKVPYSETSHSKVPNSQVPPSEVPVSDSSPSKVPISDLSSNVPINDSVPTKITSSILSPSLILLTDSSPSKAPVINSSLSNVPTGESSPSKAPISELEFASIVIEKLTSPSHLVSACETPGTDSPTISCVTPPPTPIRSMDNPFSNLQDRLQAELQPFLDGSVKVSSTGSSTQVYPETLGNNDSLVPAMASASDDTVSPEPVITALSYPDALNVPSLSSLANLACTDKEVSTCGQDLEQKENLDESARPPEGNTVPVKKERDPTKPTFRVTCHRTGDNHTFDSASAAASFGSAVVAYFNWQVDLKNFDIEILLDVEDQDVTISLALTKMSLHYRNSLVVYGPTSLRATICYNMLRLCRIRNGDFICDPMCGSSAISIEGALNWLNCFHLAGDNHDKAMEKTGLNIEAIQEKHTSNNKGTLKLDAVQWDVQHFPLRDRCIDVFVSDLPFGHRMGSRTVNRTLYCDLLYEMARTARMGARACLLTEDKSNLIKAIQTQSRYWQRRLILNINIGGLSAFVFLLTRTNSSTYHSSTNWRSSENQEPEKGAETSTKPCSSENQEIAKGAETLTNQCSSDNQEIEKGAETCTNQHSSENQELVKDSETPTKRCSSENHELEKGADTATILFSSENHELEKGAETATILSNSENQELKKGAETATILSSSENQELKKGVETATILSSSENHELEKGAETATILSSSENQELKKGTETATILSSSENQELEKSAETPTILPSSENQEVKTGVDTSIDHCGESAIFLVVGNKTADKIE